MSLYEKIMQQQKDREARQAEIKKSNFGDALRMISETAKPNYKNERTNVSFSIKGKSYTYNPASNINKFLEQKGVSSDPNVPVLRAGAQTLQDVQIAKPLDLSKIKSSQDLYDSQKQYELRKTLADYETIPSNIPRGTPKTEEPTSRRMGFGQGGGVANLGLGYNAITEPTSFTDYAFGRINTPIQETIVEDPEVIEETKTIQPDYTKIALIGIGVFAVLALIIVRMKK
jgi:hypothetical protein